MNLLLKKIISRLIDVGALHIHTHSLLPDDNINNDVEQQGVVERCSFERDLCSWAESDVDTPGAKWTRHRGQEAWPVHGPHRDHTKNSAAGILYSLSCLVV